MLFVAGCASVPEAPDEPSAAGIQVQPAPKPSAQGRGGGYYKDDGPGDKPPANLAEIPDAEPRREPLHRGANRPYVVFGKSYEPMASVQPFRQRGVASWYGRRYHGLKTSNGEVYDMYAMTAAHPTLPVPSYARVTRVSNGASVVVRINDRGPFHSDRIIDLSYVAAFKLGFAGAGSAEVEVESILPGETHIASAPKPPPAAPEPASVYVQLGAFSSKENAEDMRTRVLRQLAWLSDAVQVFASGSLWRLHVGPYRTNDAARSVAERIEAELNLKPLLVVR
jgi:rare lipoprotein A